jgi:UDPglucose 6-dehydrogenase
MDAAKEKYPKLRLVYMPEFLRERSNFVWFVNPDRLVYAGAGEDIIVVEQYFKWVESAKRLYMSYISAEIGKLAHNAYIATKVSFTNEIEKICKTHDADAEDVMSIIWADRRVKNNEHLKPLGEPYQGKCVPKDTRELMNSLPDSILLKAVENINESVKEERTICRKLV